MIGIIRHIDTNLNKLTPKVLVLLGFVSLAIVVFFDTAIGPDYSFSVFYLVPVIFTAWYAGRKLAIFMSVVGAALWLSSDMVSKSYSEYPLSLFWNDLMEFSLFLFASYVISAFRGLHIRAEKVSRIDSLTGIANRRHFCELAETEIRRARRYNDHFSLMYIDIDNFKAVNDTFGHNEGDRLLLLVAETIRQNVRESDTVARLGGDEFCLLLPETGNEEAVTVATKVHVDLKAAVEKKWPITFSIGMVTYSEAPTSTEEMIRIADQLMYKVKNAGKDELRHLIVPERA